MYDLMALPSSLLEWAQLRSAGRTQPLRRSDLLVAASARYVYVEAAGVQASRQR